MVTETTLIEVCICCSCVLMIATTLFCVYLMYDYLVV